MSGLSRGWAKRWTLALALAAISVLGAWSHGAARALGPSANFAYVTFNPGWNIVSFAGGGDYSGDAFKQYTDNALYSLRPNATSYETDNPSDTRAGYGYWLRVNRRFQVVLDLSDRDSATLNVPAGQCAMMGNPSTKGSAHVHGAERVFEFSPITNSYIPTSLIGVGRGALVCNDTRGGTVSIAYEADAPQVNWPTCCQRGAEGSTPNGGQGFLRFENNLNAPLIVSLRQLDPAGEPLSSGDVLSGYVAACDACTAENTQRAGCTDIGVSLTESMTPGSYTLHLQPEQPDEPDYQLNIDIAADTKYELCLKPTRR